MANTPIFQLFAVTESGPRQLPIPPEVTRFDELYTELSLGVYSSLRTFEHNKFLYLDQHLARTVNSMRLLGWDYALDEKMLREAIHMICTAFPTPEMRVRIDILAEPAYAYGTDSRLLVGVFAFVPLADTFYEKGVTVQVVQGLNRENPHAKTADFIKKRKAYEVGGTDIYEYLMADEQGQILEGMSSNFYAFHNGTLYTADEGVLEGVTRRIILNLAAKLDIPMRLKAIHIDDISALDEAAISSSSRGLLPVVKIDDTLLGQGAPGPTCQRLLQAYRQFIRGEIKRAVG